MLYDLVWFCESLNREFWEEYSEMLDEGQTQEADSKWRRYHGDLLKFAVVLRAGEAFLFDELYLFLNEADARRFFEGGPVEYFLEESYREREFKIDGRAIGFFERSLYIAGKRIICDISGHGDRASTGAGCPDILLREAPSDKPRPRSVRQ